MSRQRFSGTRNEYRWYQASDLFLGELLDKVPGLVCNRFVAVTSFDSGPLRLSETERADGWRTVACIAISPRIEDASTLPYDQYDEWYIFEDSPTLNAPEVFVNYGCFSLREPESELGYVDPTWDQVLIRQRLDWLREAQDRFWRQLAAVDPESYLAHGGNLICVTRSREGQEALDRLFW